MNFKRTWLFWLVIFIVPLLAIVLAGICGNEIGIYDESVLYITGEFLHSIVVSVSTSLIAAGVVYLFIDKKLRELLAHDEVITVVLKTKEGETKECPPMSRKDFCRQEVLGYLGMLGGPERFSLNYMKKKEFGKRILEIQQGKGNEKLTIHCTDDEFKQFDSDYHVNDDITVVLRSESGKEIKCPPMPRKAFNRAEVLSYIGMLSDAQQFDIASLKSRQFGEDLLKVSKSKEQLLVIPCTDQEFESLNELG
ncbi:hypothetical protein [Vibrio palustris]|uniref:Uncharacterized protein n=1 Tax=Vibrio palustris TaxID=1918946 RepID=A0A1R4B2T7_9VIBR|nr:hypothetical protein [Vibrio palustris]SJL83228.1 hypothetical protein VPAL9027_01182 [Vibrio palustris]